MVLIKLHKCRDDGTPVGPILVNPDSINFIESRLPSTTALYFDGGQVRWVNDSPDEIAVLIKHAGGS